MKPFKFLTNRPDFGIPNFHYITDVIFDLCKDGEHLPQISNKMFTTLWGKFIIICVRDPQFRELYHIREDMTIDIGFVCDPSGIEELFVNVLFIPNHGQPFYIKLVGEYNTDLEEYLDETTFIQPEFTDNTFDYHLTPEHIRNNMTQIFIN